MKKIILILILLILTACGKSLKDFETKEFILSNLNNDYKITLSFEGEKLYGFSGVNRYFGSFKLDGNKIEISNLAMTKMAGPPEEMKAEQAYLDLLNKAVKFEILKDNLILYTDNNEKLEFVLTKDK